MGYEIDYPSAERVGCSSRIEIEDRVFYVKLFCSEESRFFCGDQKGVIHKEISKAEFDLWLNILTDDKVEVLDIQKKLGL